MHSPQTTNYAPSNRRKSRSVLATLFGLGQHPVLSRASKASLTPKPPWRQTPVPTSKRQTAAPELFRHYRTISASATSARRLSECASVDPVSTASASSVQRWGGPSSPPSSKLRSVRDAPSCIQSECRLSIPTERSISFMLNLDGPNEKDPLQILEEIEERLREKHRVPSKVVAESDVDAQAKERRRLSPRSVYSGGLIQRNPSKYVVREGRLVSTGLKQTN